MFFFKKLLPFALICLLLLSACGSQNVPVENSSANDVSTEDMATEITPTLAFIEPEISEPEPWGIIVSNQKLDLQISLMDSVFSLPFSYRLLDAATGETLCIPNEDNGFSCVLDDNGYITSMYLEEGWTFNSQISVGDSVDKLVELYGGSVDDDPLGYAFLKDGNIGEYFSSSDVHVFFYKAGNSIKRFSVSAFGQLPTPILIADGVCEIYSCTPSEPNSAGGVDISIDFRNLSSKTIKYITFSVTPFNAVDDPVFSEIGSKSTVNLKFTGPVNPAISKGEYSSAAWATVWYNSTIKYCKIDSVTIEYMDGEILDIPVI